MRHLRLLAPPVLAALFLTPQIASAQSGYTVFPDEPRDPPQAAPAPAPAPAPGLAPAPGPPFGSHGQVVISTNAALSLTSTKYDNSQAIHRGVTVGPAFDVFVVDNLSVGAVLSASYSEGRGYGANGSLVVVDETTFAAGVRTGYVVHLGSAVSWWPRVEIGFESSHFEEKLASGNTFSIPSSPLGYPATTNDGPYVSVSAPLLFHVAPHFYFGLGPTFFRELSSTKGGPDVGGQRTTFGATFTTGGYFGGASEGSVAAAPQVAAPRFGDAGQLVITGEISSTGISSTTYQGTGSSSFGFSVAPGLDYFVADHVSLGGAIYGSYSTSKAIDATTGASVENTVTSYEAHARLGVDVPLGAWLSWYPRAWIGVGSNGYDETSAGNENKDARAIVDVGAYAPLLIHPVPHYFIGFGPSVYHELDAPDDAGRELRKTTIGASLVIGGWIATR